MTNNLADRCEAASGADRELDALFKLLAEAERALEGARVFILRETGCRNPYRDDVLKDIRAALRAKEQTNAR